MKAKIGMEKTFCWQKVHMTRKLLGCCFIKYIGLPELHCRYPPNVF